MSGFVNLRTQPLPPKACACLSGEGGGADQALYRGRFTRDVEMLRQVTE